MAKTCFAMRVLYLVLGTHRASFVIVLRYPQLEQMCVLSAALRVVFLRARNADGLPLVRDPGTTQTITREVMRRVFRTYVRRSPPRA